MIWAFHIWWTACLSFYMSIVRLLCHGPLLERFVIDQYNNKDNLPIFWLHKCSKLSLGNNDSLQTKPYRPWNSMYWNYYVWRLSIYFSILAWPFVHTPWKTVFHSIQFFVVMFHSVAMSLILTAMWHLVGLESPRPACPSRVTVLTVFIPLFVTLVISIAILGNLTGSPRLQAFGYPWTVEVRPWIRITFLNPDF